MKAPEAALIRARAKAPLAELLALHLSNAGIECIKHLELCTSLQSLYADGNRIRDVEGLAVLRKLWWIDLSGNALKQLQPLASFPALGFLSLERNQLRFEDLVCLRDQHLLELRVFANTGLLEGNTVDEYRMKVVALLPNVWILDGHFISVLEREKALETYDSFVLYHLKLAEKTASNDSKFGSTTDVWAGGTAIATQDTTASVDAETLIHLAHKIQPRPSESVDLRRLRAIVTFHNNGSSLHNAYCHFAPSKHAPNARLMPKIWLDETLALPRRTRLEVMVLLATFLEFQFPKVLLLEALTIRQLDCPGFPSQAIRDTANLPPYALVALLAVARHHTADEEASIRHTLQPEVETREFSEQSDILTAIPPTFTTLLSTATSTSTSGSDDDSEQQARVTRCRFAIKLLSNVASFPGLKMTANRKVTGKKATILRDLAPLLHAAKPPSRFAAAPECDVVVPHVLINGPSTEEEVSAPRTNDAAPWKRSLGPDCVSSTEEHLKVSPHITKLTQLTAANGARRRPRPGEWMEVRPKQFVKIHFLSADGQLVVGALPTDATRSITISCDQMTRVSSGMWRVDFLTQRQMEEFTSGNGGSTSSFAGPSSARIGKLHRDSEAFHRHGAARNQGFPNHFVTNQILKDLDRGREYLSEQAERPGPTLVELFSSDDTLDANYVLTSPQLVSAQNFCAINAFHQRRHTPAGLWSPIKQPAPYSVLASSTQGASRSTEPKTCKKRGSTKLANAAQPPPRDPDDWLEIQQEMRIQLGLQGPRSETDPGTRPSSSSSYSSELAATTYRDVACFLTAVPGVMADAQHVAASSSDLQFDSAAVGGSDNPTAGWIVRMDCPAVAKQPTTTHLAASASQPRLADVHAAPLASKRVWHQVATKPQFVVSGVVGAPTAPQVLAKSLSAPTLPSRTAVAALHTLGTSAPACGRLAHCNVVLPSLSPSRQRKAQH